MDEPATKHIPLPGTWPPWWAYPLLVPGPLLVWQALIARELAGVAGAPTWLASPASAWAGAGVMAVLVLGESALYGMLWAARGARLPIAAGFLAALQLSMLEAFALELVEHAPTLQGVLLAGSRAMGAAEPAGGFGRAFGSFGVLTIARMALWAWAQAEQTGRRWREAATLVAAVWLASHVVQGFLIELILGRSATP